MLYDVTPMAVVVVVLCRSFVPRTAARKINQVQTRGHSMAVEVRMKSTGRVIMEMFQWHLFILPPQRLSKPGSMYTMPERLAIPD